MLEKLSVLLHSLIDILVYVQKILHTPPLTTTVAPVKGKDVPSQHTLLHSPQLSAPVKGKDVPSQHTLLHSPQLWPQLKTRMSRHSTHSSTHHNGGPS